MKKLICDEFKFSIMRNGTFLLYLNKKYKCLKKAKILDKYYVNNDPYLQVTVFIKYNIYTYIYCYCYRKINISFLRRLMKYLIKSLVHRFIVINVYNILIHCL